METMELQSIEFLTNYSYFSSEIFFQSHEFPECSQQNSFSSLSENSPQNSLQEGSFLEYSDQHLLQMDPFDQFEPINYHSADFLTTTMDHQNIEELCNSRPVDEEEEEEEEEEKEDKSNNIFKGIQAELMEEESLTDLLLAAAEAVETQNQPLVSNLIEKLKNLLLCDMGSSSFNQLAWFFTQGLYYKTVDYNMADQDHYQIKNNYNSMSAFQMLQQLSPYVKFAHFTANQAILEAAEGERMIHVIDFDIMEGIQWPPLMADLAAKKDVCSLRLTAIVQNKEDEREIEQTGRRLTEFAKSINFPFIFDQMGIGKEEDFGEIQVLGQTVIANCSGILQHILSHRNLSKLEAFLGGITKLSPKCVVLVEEELFKVSKPQPMSFVEFFFEAFHHFSALSDSLVRCFSGVYENGFKQVMEEFLGKRILDSVSQFPCDKNVRKNLLENAFDHLKGYKKIPFSSFNYSQAKYLISLFRGDFWVQHEKCSLSLCWKSRPLCTATIWVPTRVVEQKYEQD